MTSTEHTTATNLDCIELGETNPARRQSPCQIFDVGWGTQTASVKKDGNWWLIPIKTQSMRNGLETYAELFFSYVNNSIYTVNCCKF